MGTCSQYSRVLSWHPPSFDCLLWATHQTKEKMKVCSTWCVMKECPEPLSSSDELKKNPWFETLQLLIVHVWTISSYTFTYVFLSCFCFLLTDDKKTGICCGGYVGPCSPIFLSAMSAAPTDGLMRAIHVLSYFPQSAHSRRFDRRQLWTKNTEEASKLLRHTRAWTRRETEIYSEGQNNIRDTSWCT